MAKGRDGDRSGSGSTLRLGRRSIVLASVWAIATAVALVLTLRSLAVDEFDGLNNALQIPLALPWFLLPVGWLWSYETDAWVVAAMGWLNASLILLFGNSILQAFGRRSRP